MRNKIVIVSLLAGVTAAAVIAVVAVAFFAFAGSAPVQAEEVTVIEAVSPSQVAPVSQQLQVEKPARTYERASYAGKTGGCSYSAKQLMVESPSQPEQVNKPLLSMVGTE